MSKLLFIKKFLKKRKQVGAILPSSIFLAKKMVLKKDLDKANVIVELGAGSGVFTKRIFKLLGTDIKNKKVFIIEKDKDFYKILIKRFPKYRDYIFNIDLLDLEKIFFEHNIKNIDLVISGLPFKSLPKDIFSFLIDNFLGKYFGKDSKFIQFSYFANFKKDLLKNFTYVKRKNCILNIPPSFVFRCKNLKKKK